MLIRDLFAHIAYDAEGAGGPPPAPAPDPAPPAPAVEPAAPPAGAEPPAVPAEPTPTEQKPGTPKWAVDRIGTLTAHWRGAERERDEHRTAAETARAENARLQAELHALRQGVTPPPPPPGTPAPAAPPASPGPAQPPLSRDEFDRAVATRADTLAKAQAFNADCDRTYTTGKAAHADFDQAVEGFKLVGGVNEPFLRAVNALPNGADVFYHLGRDPERASGVLAMVADPVRMGIELYKLSTDLAKPAPVSRAPAPVPPHQGGSAAPVDPDPAKMTTAEWIAHRNKQVSERAARR